MTKIEAQQKIADLVDEQAQRQQAVDNAQRTKETATARLSQLRAMQALDGVDVAKRITAAEKEITAADATLSLWPDVQAELGRRLATAQAALQASIVGEMKEELTSLLAAERGRRLAFAEAIHNAAQCGHDLRLLLNRKSYLKSELYAAGVVVNAGDLEMGNHPRYFGEQVAIDEARRFVDEYRAH